MFASLKALFSKKTFWMAIAGSAVVSALGFILPALGLGPAMVEDVLMYVSGFFGLGLTNLVSADFGKEKAKIEAGQ